MIMFARVLTRSRAITRVKRKGLGAHRVCNGVQLKMTINFIRACVCLFEFLLIRIIHCNYVLMIISEHRALSHYSFAELSRVPNKMLNDANLLCSLKWSTQKLEI